MVTPAAIQCEYDVPVVGGLSAAAMEALVGSAPVDFTPLDEFGLFLRQDVTGVAGPLVKRIMTAQFMPNTPATGTFSLEAGIGTPGAPITRLSLTDSGDGYAGPPIVQFQAPDGSIIVPTSGIFPPKAHALMGASSVVMLNGGKGYTGAVSASFVGGQLAPGGVQATAGAITLDGGGAITAIAVATPGGLYNVPPHLVITDVPGGGSGAVAIGTLKVTSLVLNSPGRTIPIGSMGFVPPFLLQAPFNVPETQKSTLRGWMTAVIAKAARTPVIEIDPILVL